MESYWKAFLVPAYFQEFSIRFRLRFNVSARPLFINWSRFYAFDNFLRIKVTLFDYRSSIKNLTQFSPWKINHSKVCWVDYVVYKLSSDEGLASVAKFEVNIPARYGHLSWKSIESITVEIILFICTELT